MLTAFFNVLVGDSTLNSLLPGGIHQAQAIDSISRQNTPTAFDANGEILPCALLKSESVTPWGPYPDSAREYVLLYFYQRFGYAVIRAASQRAYLLLHRTRIATEDGLGLWQIDHANDILDTQDQALGASMVLSRYVVTMQRR